MPPHETNQRSLWQVLGLFLAGSWLCLQVIDVLGQNIALPGWLFPLTLALLVLGLPVVALTAYLHGLGGSKAASTPAEKRGVRRNPVARPDRAAGVVAYGFEPARTRSAISWPVITGTNSKSTRSRQFAAHSSSNAESVVSIS